MSSVLNKMAIIISRTDSIGDVVLTLPMAGIIKAQIPGCKLIFLGRDYTKDVIALSEHVDEFISYDSVLKLNKNEQIQYIKQLQATHIIHVFPVKHIAVLAKKAGIKNRIGTTNRFWHWYTCNYKIKLSRKNSELHEAQLNAKLLSALSIPTDYSTEQLINYYGFTKLSSSNDSLKSYVKEGKKTIILHPKSKGSAREWGLENFSRLISAIDKNKYTVLISGTATEGELVKDLIKNHPEVTDLTGKLNLQEFICLINKSDGLIAASTGPLHIAAALGKKAIGLFAPMRPIHPGRWRPLGKKASYLVLDKNCDDCKKNNQCLCIKQIKVNEVLQKINEP